MKTLCAFGLEDQKLALQAGLVRAEGPDPKTDIKSGDRTRSRELCRHGLQTRSARPPCASPGAARPGPHGRSPFRGVERGPRGKHNFLQFPASRSRGKSKPLACQRLLFYFLWRRQLEEGWEGLEGLQDRMTRSEERTTTPTHRAAMKGRG